MITILDNSLKRLAILKQVLDANRFEEINGENKLDFTAVYDSKAAEYINENNLAELDEDYFDVIFYQKQQNEDGTLTIQVQSEHVSYRLNDPLYNMEMFTATGTPTEVLTQILAGTPFTVGTVEFTDQATYSAQEAKSRRQMLIEFVAVLGGEVDFDKFTVSIVQHRGGTDRKLLAKGKDIKVVSKTFNGREKDKNGNNLITYTCTPIQTEPLALGDEILLIQKDLGIQENLRIVRYGYNPYDNIEAAIELANFVSGLEDQIYRIETQTVAKEKVYNGCKIGPDEGFVATRSDNKVKSVLNATEGIAVKTGDGNGSFANKFYVDTEGNLHLDGTFLDIVKGAVRILLSPTDGIKIQDNGTDVFWVDTAGKLNLKDIIAAGIITAISGLNVSSNAWNAGTDHGLIFGGNMEGYSAPATIKYTQGLSGDGSSELAITAFQLFLNGLATAASDLLVMGDFECRGAADLSGSNITYLANGCYLEARSDGLRLHTDAANYIHIGVGNIYAYTDGVAKPIAP